MLKRYIFYLILGPISNTLWAFWALPEIGEQGTWAETLQWMCTQAIIPAVATLFLAFNVKFVLWLLIIYSGFIILFAVGIFGWALMGPGTPVSIYVVCAVLFTMGFGLLYQSMKDLNLGKEIKSYQDEDERI